MVVRADLGSHLPREVQLVGVALVLALVADAERLDRQRLALGEQRGVRAGVDAAGQEDADRNVTDLAQRHGLAQLGQHPLLDLSLVDTDERLGVVPHVPVALLAERPVSADADPAAAGHLLDAGEQRLRRGCREEGQVVEERLLVDLALLLRVGEQRLDLAAEGHPAVVPAVVERLLADPVADEPQLLLALVPHREGEHPAELLQAVDAPLLGTRGAGPRCRSGRLRQSSTPSAVSSARMSAWL